MRRKACSASFCLFPSPQNIRKRERCTQLVTDRSQLVCQLVNFFCLSLALFHFGYDVGGHPVAGRNKRNTGQTDHTRLAGARATCVRVGRRPHSLSLAHAAVPSRMCLWKSVAPLRSKFVVPPHASTPFLFGSRCRLAKWRERHRCHILFDAGCPVCTPSPPLIQ